MCIFAHRWILVYGFGEAWSETRKAKVGDPKGRQRRWGSRIGSSKPPPHQLGGLEERCKLPQRGPGRSPAAKQFSRILNTQDNLSRQQDYGPIAKHMKHINKSLYLCFLKLLAPKFLRRQCLSLPLIKSAYVSAIHSVHLAPLAEIDIKQNTTAAREK